MTAVTVDGDYDQPEAPERGPTGLAAYIEALVKRDAGTVASSGGLA